MLTSNSVATSVIGAGVRATVVVAQASLHKGWNMHSPLEAQSTDSEADAGFSTLTRTEVHCVPATGGCDRLNHSMLRPYEAPTHMRGPSVTEKKRSIQGLLIVTIQSQSIRCACSLAVAHHFWDRQASRSSSPYLTE